MNNHKRKNEVTLLLTPYTKINSKIDKRLKNKK